MWNSFSKRIVKPAKKLVHSSVSVPVATSVSPAIKVKESTKADVKKQLDVGRHDRIAEILGKVRLRNGMKTIPSHIEHLVGKVSDSNLPGLDLGEKTQFILQSCHPVRHVLEREMYNYSKQHAKYFDWLALFGRGIRTSDNPKYEDVVDLISRGADCGMFSSDIHQTMIDVPEDYTCSSSGHLTQYSLGNKYATLVGDYFAIRCIYFVEKARNAKAFIAITKGLEQFTRANFSVSFLDKTMKYPILPEASANLDAWIKYNKKTSGYFIGGVYAILLANYDGLPPKKEKLMEGVSRFSSNLAVLLKGVSDIEMFESGQNFSSVPSLITTTLPAILHLRSSPTFLNSVRSNKLNFTVDFKQIAKEIQGSNAIHEAQYLMKELAHETRKNWENIAVEPFHYDIIPELIDTVVDFDFD